MAKNPYSRRAQKLNQLRSMTDVAYLAGNIDKKEHEEIRGKLYNASMDNIFAAMAGYCM